jgi:hypothetical protein
MVCLTGTEPVVFATATTGCNPFFALAHLALCACAIFRREAPDIIRVGWFACLTVPVPFNDSITEIACQCSLHVPALACAQHEAAEAHLLGFPWFPLKI